MKAQAIITALRRGAATAAALALATAQAAAQQPASKPTTIVVGYTAGGQADALARAVGKQLSEVLKTPVIVENKPGANGLIAAQSVAQAKPDGHTLLLVTDAMTTIDPQLPGSAAKLDYSATLEPVINLATAPLFLAAHKDVPADTLPGLIELGRRQPNSLSFGTSGNATPHRLTGEMLQKLGGFQMVHVPYKGTAASVTDLARSRWSSGHQRRSSPWPRPAKSSSWLQHPPSASPCFPTLPP
jgi:tripartite-type tricarboxylate transporter receptor subunit TctC